MPPTPPPTPLTIDHTVQARLIARPGSRPVPATLRYDSSDPLALRIVFPAEAALDGAEVTWLFARALLDEALRGPAGLGDVRFWPSRPGRTVLELKAPEGTALVELATEDLHRFLAATYAFVPAAEETNRLDLDGTLTALLGPV
ncbi:SsgA family sporulation/cell division regulator [Streptomyces sp. TRM 70351]|uniref:SsgA family sporulation/cell division regulator n=1 Tax=Streptomyces sp. TRM 70351 TaxID=3116552 RepID=UPI002E7BCFB7|nr:SsgA family sporulation/cell division regulator [Streptomyces sp. TRM 70351]MEE1929474.1 SsgA family sporulation/cell division regulator [Streptomyces sp. TRM 70351]